MRTFALLLMLGACGRIGFDERGDGALGGGDDAVVGGNVVTPSPTGMCPALAASNVGFGVAWREGPLAVGDIMFASYDDTGQMLWGPTVVAAAFPNVECPTIAWNGADFLVGISYGTTADHDIAVVRVLETGALPQQVVVNDTGNSTSPRIAVRGGTTVITWEHGIGAGSIFQVQARPLNQAGIPTAATYTASVASDNGPPSITSTATGFAITWWTGNTQRLRVLDANGAATGAELILGPSNSSLWVSSVWNGSDLVLAWPDVVANNVRTAKWALDGTISAGPYSIVAPMPANVNITFDGAAAAVVYQTSTGGTDSIRFARLDSAGQVVTDQLVVETVPLVSGLAWTGNRFAIGYSDGTGAHVKLVSP